MMKNAPDFTWTENYEEEMSDEQPLTLYSTKKMKISKR